MLRFPRCVAGIQLTSQASLYPRRHENSGARALCAALAPAHLAPRAPTNFLFFQRSKKKRFFAFFALVHPSAQDPFAHRTNFPLSHAAAVIDFRFAPRAE